MADGNVFDALLVVSILAMPVVVLEARLSRRPLREVFFLVATAAVALASLVS